LLKVACGLVIIESTTTIEYHTGSPSDRCGRLSATFRYPRAVCGLDHSFAELLLIIKFFIVVKKHLSKSRPVKKVGSFKVETLIKSKLVLKIKTLN
jgi:hypothetical protein